jgi:hypothetical protein
MCIVGNPVHMNSDQGGVKSLLGLIMCGIQEPSLIATYLIQDAEQYLHNWSVLTWENV